MFPAGGNTFTTHLRAFFIIMWSQTPVFLDLKSLQHWLNLIRSYLVRKTRLKLRELAAAEAEKDMSIGQTLQWISMKDNLVLITLIVFLVIKCQSFAHQGGHSMSLSLLPHCSCSCSCSLHCLICQIRSACTCYQ